MIRTIAYSIGLGLLVFVGGCAVGEAIASILPTDAHDPDVIKDTGQQVGNIVSYFWPAVGGAITTAGSVVANVLQFFQGSNRKKAIQELVELVDDGALEEASEKCKQVCEALGHDFHKQET